MEKLDTIEQDERYRQLVDGRSEGERNALLTQAALAQMRADPVRTAALAVGKGFDFWLPDFFIASNLRSGSFGRSYPDIWRLVLPATVGIFLVVIGAALIHASLHLRAW
ncbi:MAG: hypothetical protein WCP29_08360 [Acidobacteriota bacterium]